MSTEHDYDLSKKIKITFKGMDYYVMPRYRDHYLNHEYERFSLQILKNNLSKDTLFVDVGAHYGAYSLYAAHESGSKVYAVEPVTENLALLNQNVQVNKLESLIRTFDYAASDENGEAVFNIPWASDSAGFYNHPNAETIRRQKVITKKIDDVIMDSKVHIIKIDTEGHELGVLNGLKRTLKNNPQVQLIIEINPPLLESAGTSAEALLEMVKGFDKEIYMVDEDGFTLHRITDRLEAWPKYINEGNYANLYCVPAKDSQYLMFVSHTSQLGGAELAMLEQISELRRRGMFSHVILPGNGPLEARLIEKGIGYSVVSDYSFWISQDDAAENPEILQERNFNNMKAALEIAEIAAQIAPTMIVNNSIVNPWGYPAAQALGIPLVWMIHEFGDLDHNLPFTHGINPTREFIAQSADLVVCCSEAVRASLLRGKQSPNVQTVYNFLDLDRVVRLAEVEAKPAFRPGQHLKLCVVGMLSEGKGQAEVIDAAAELIKQGKKVELLLIGASSPGHEEILKKRVRKLGITDSVSFLGFVDNPYPHIKAADAVVVASRSEAFGRVTAEAMALGVSVVASNKGGSLEMVNDGKTGFLYEASDVQDLVQAIRKFSKTSPKDLATMRSKARQNVHTLLDLQTNSDKLVDLLGRLRLEPGTVSTKPIMVTEWMDALRLHQRKIVEMEARLQSKLDQARTQASGQEQINLDQAKLLTDIVNSKSYRLATKLSKLKSKIKP